MAAEPSPTGAGGPFRRRPFRRAATPYDRPSVAARQPGGWISRVVDPASRMIAAGASRFLAPIFRKRLAAPPVETPQAQGNEHIESAATNIECATTDVQFKEPAPDIVPMNCICEAKNDAESSKVNSNCGPVFELEELLKQKTFTRVEYDRLSELLRSRTVDLSPEKETKRVEHVTSGPILQLDKMQKGTALLENGAGGPKLFQEISRPNADVNVPEEDIASPTELAKTYMGSRSSKLLAPISSLRYLAPREAPMVPTTRQLMPPPSADILSAPRSSARVSGLGGNAYRTPRSQGRSAISRMSQSPYFKPQQMVSAQGRELSGEAYAAPSTSQLTPSSGSKQALKRRSPFLDNDPGSFGPIRRIRQKSNLASHSKENSHTASGYQSFSTPTQRLFSPSGYNRDFPALEYAKNVENGNSYSEFPSSTPQSSVMARKILQHIDQMAPSPKEKREDKMITKDEFPSELTVNMLNGQALKSVKEIDSSKLSDGKIHEKLGSDNDVVKRSSQASFPSMEESVENEKHSKSPKVSKAFSGIGGADGLDATQANNKGSAAAACSASAGFPATLHNKRPSFQMQAPEDSWELDADMYGTGGSTLPIEKRENEKSSLSKASDVTIKTVSNTKLFESSTEKKLNLNTMSGKGTESGCQNGLGALGKDNGFKFAVSSFNTDPALPPTPSFSTITPPKEQIPARFSPPKDQSVAPVFDFGSKKTTSLAFTSATPNASGSAVMKLGEMPNSKVEIPGSITSTVTMSKTETPESDKGKEGEKVSEPLKPFGSFTSAFATTGAASASSLFGYSTSSAPSNGTLTFTPSTTSVSASAALPASDTMATPTVSTPNNQQIFDSTSKPVSPPVTSFESEFALKPSPTDLVPATMSRFESKYLEPKASKGSGFGVTSFSAPVSSIFSSSTSGIFGFNASAPSNASSASGQSSSTQPPPLSTGAFIFGQSSSSELASSISFSTPALSSSSSFGLSSTVFGSSAAGSKPFSFGASSGSGLNSSTTSSASVAAPSFSTSSPFGSSMSSPGLFSTSQPAATSMFGSGSSSSGFSFGQSPTLSANAPTFGSASVPAFSFTSAASAAPAAPVSPQQSGFGTSTPVTFGSSISGGDQMSVEDSMTDDTVQLSLPVPAFGQATPSPTQPVAFGSSLQPSDGVGFQFGGQPAPSFPQSQSPFQTSGSLDFQQGGSFSLGSGGGVGDKSNRRMVKVKRDKHRKK